MSCAMVRLGIGTRVNVDGETFAITELLPTTEVILTGATGAHRMSLVALLNSADLLDDKKPSKAGGRK